MTIFTIGTGGVLSGGTSYALPSGCTSPLGAAFSPNGSYLAITDNGSNGVTIFSLGTGGVLTGGTSYSLPSGSINPVSVEFSPDGAYIAIANNSNDVTLY